MNAKYDYRASTSSFVCLVLPYKRGINAAYDQFHEWWWKLISGIKICGKWKLADKGWKMKWTIACSEILPEVQTTLGAKV